MTHEDKIKPVTVAVFFLILIYIGRVQELFPALDNLNIGKVVMLIGLVLYISEPGKTSWKLLSEIKQLKLFLLILLWMVLSVPFSVWPSMSFAFLTDCIYKYALLFFLLIAVVNRRAEIILISWGLAASAFILGLKTLLHEKIDRLTVSKTYDPNDLAFVMVTLLPIVYFMMKNERGVKRYLLMATALSMVLTIVYTGSRGGFIGLIAIYLVIVVYEKKSLLKTLCIGLCVCFLVISTASAPFWERMSQVFDGKSDYNYEADSGRIAIWKRGITMMLSNPMLGVGVGQFMVAEGLSHQKGKWSVAHNSLIQVGGELGVVGLIIYLKLLSSSHRIMRECRKYGRTTIFPEWLMSGIEVSLIGFLAAGFFLSQAYSIVLFVLIGLTVICSSVTLNKVGELGNKTTD